MIVNILEHQQYIPKFRKLLDRIVEGNDRTAENYGAFFHGDRIFENLSVDVRLDSSGEIIEFSTLFGNGNRFPKGCARVNNRYWLHEDYRSSGLVMMDASMSRELMQPQIALAKQLGLDMVFFSTEFTRRRESYRRILQRFHQEEFILLDGMYNTCGQDGCDVSVQGCWQNVCVKWLKTPGEFPLPRMEVSEWNAIFLGNHRD